MTCHEHMLVFLGCSPQENSQLECSSCSVTELLSAVLAPAADADLGRCLAADGLYLYTTNSVGRGISKLGSGLHGTLR